MVRRNSKGAKITAAIMLTLWLVPLLVSFVFYGIVIINALEAGNVTIALIFTFFFGGVCLYLYRTFAGRDEIRSWFR